MHRCPSYYQYDVLCDKIDSAAESHVVKNFVNSGKVLKGEPEGAEFRGMVFQDSDAAKWLEAAAYSPALKTDPELRKKAEDLIELIENAQDSDGYLNTFYTIKDKEKRWTNLLEGHELYCSGHMIEAGCAFYEATGNRRLLDICEKNALHIYRVFIENGHEGYPGHPEIELALLKLYDLTKNEKYLTLAKHFIDVRGVDSDFFIKEAKERHWSVWNGDGRNKHYQQSHLPVRQQSDAVGHSVRAVYLYTAMADLAQKTQDKELFDSCKRLWESIVQKRMYVTGGIGSTVHGEAFTEDYDLPSDTAYAETCASIGLVFFASKMLQNELKGEYADIMELSFYNTVLAGMEHDGKRFFYVNPLEVVPGITGQAVTHRHVLTQRPGWYTCACCPPNVARLINSLGKYAYGENSTTAFCHLFAGGDVKFENGIHLSCKTAYPYGSDISYKATGKGKLAVRIPRWSKNTAFVFNNKRITPQTDNGYAVFEINGEAELEINLDCKPRILYPNPKIPTLSKTACLMKGPLVYCFEGNDNKGDVLSLSLDTAEKIEEKESDILGGTVILEAKGFRQTASAELYSEIPPAFSKETLTAIPYYLWGNRGVNQMRVWLPVK